MVQRLPVSSYAVLGLLSIAPMSGYDLTLAAERTIAGFFPISKTQVYSELSRLEGLGLVRARDVAQERRPDKRVFELTESGETALDGWLSIPGPEGDSVRMPSLLKLFFGHRLPGVKLVELLDGHQRLARAAIERLSPLVALLETEPDAVHARATALYGLRMAEATVAWVGEVEGQIERRKGAINPRRRVAPTAMRLFRAAPPPPSGRSRSARENNL
jgi:DNA-binding PadR family transcriptional regulator